MTSLRTRSKRTVALVAGGLFLTTACGSRISRSDVVAAEGSAASSIGQQAAAAETGAVAPTTTTGAGAGAPVPGGTGGQVIGGTSPGSTGTAPTSYAGVGTTPSTGSATHGGTTGAGAAVAHGCAKEGPPVVIGQVGAFSGIVGANVQNAVTTLPAWVKDVNSRGGLGCHPVILFQKDSAADPAKAESAVKDLVEGKGAVALVANQVTLEITGFRKGVEEEKVAAVGGDQDNPDWHQSPELFPVGGTERAKFAGSVQAPAAIGKKKIAIFYCIEASACTAYKNTLDQDGFAKRVGAQIVYESQFSLTQSDFSALCQSAKNAGAQVIVFAGDGAGVSRTARSCHTVGLDVPIAITAAQATFNPDDENMKRATASLASPVFPFTQKDNAAEKEFRAAMARYNPDSRLDTVSAVTWSSAKMLERAVELLGPSAQSVPLTSALIHKGLGLIRAEQLGGLIPPTTFTFGQAAAPENLCFTPLSFTTAGTFIAPVGTRFTCL